MIGCVVSARAGSPFAIRGIKGLCWDGAEKYQKALPWLAEHKLNFLMICYTSFPESAVLGVSVRPLMRPARRLTVSAWRSPAKTTCRGRRSGRKNSLRPIL